MKKIKMLAAMALVMVLFGCSTAKTGDNQNKTPENQDVTTVSAVEIKLSDKKIEVDGVRATTALDNGVYTGNDIIYYEEGKDFTYGEGTDRDSHSAEVAKEHTVVYITKPGTYSISGKLSKGQIAVDLGDDADENPEAVVNLILNGVDITCGVAPAIIFYNVYECGSDDADSAVKDVDTSTAGANVIIADGTTNTVNGSYVARIYKPESVVLDETGTKVADSKKLHKYDGAFYSRMSMNVGGGKENSGILTINAENEGLDSELHLTINGGIININSGNDGINTNEDGVSVTTINGGELNIHVTGTTGEGDGIDSNGWLVINGGAVTTQACSFSADAGIDSDMGIHINGGIVVSSGHMLDRIEDGGQNYAVFTFANKQSGSNTISLKDNNGDSLMEFCPENDYSMLIYSSPNLKVGTYTLWSNEQQLAAYRGETMGRPGMPGMSGMKPDGVRHPEFPEGQLPEGAVPTFPEGQLPEGDMPTFPEGMTMPDGKIPFEGQIPPQGMENPWGNKGEGRPGGNWKPDNRNDGLSLSYELTTEFEISEGGNMFQGISEAE